MAADFISLTSELCTSNSIVKSSKEYDLVNIKISKSAPALLVPLKETKPKRENKSNSYKDERNNSLDKSHMSLPLKKIQTSNIKSAANEKVCVKVKLGDDTATLESSSVRQTAFTPQDEPCSNSEQVDDLDKLELIKTFEEEILNNISILEGNNTNPKENSNPKSDVNSNIDSMAFIEMLAEQVVRSKQSVLEPFEVLKDYKKNKEGVYVLTKIINTSYGIESVMSEGFSDEVKNKWRVVERNEKERREQYQKLKKMNLRKSEKIEISINIPDVSFNASSRLGPKISDTEADSNSSENFHK